MPNDNAFDPEFLDRLADEDSPGTTLEASTAGPWRVEPAGPGRWAVLQEGDPHPRGVFTDRTVALLVAAMLPAGGRETAYLLGPELEAEGYPLQTVRGKRGLETVGWLAVFDEALVEALHGADHLVRSPSALALLMEAAGGEALQRAGAMLAEAVRRGEPDLAAVVERVLGVEPTPEQVGRVRDVLRRFPPHRPGGGDE